MYSPLSAYAGQITRRLLFPPFIDLGHVWRIDQPYALALPAGVHLCPWTPLGRLIVRTTLPATHTVHWC